MIETGVDNSLKVKDTLEGIKVTPSPLKGIGKMEPFKPIKIPNMFKPPKITPLKMLKLSEDAAFRQLLKARKETNTNPSPKQIKAENYKKGVFQWNGLTIAIENPKGSVRSGVSPDGKKWSTKMANDYGYIKRTKSQADGDAVDVFIGDNLKSNIVYIVDQTNKDGSFDEHKCIIGANTIEDAKRTYLANYEKGWKCGKVTGMTIDHFKKWIYTGDTGKPVSELNLFRVKGSKR